MLEFYRINRIIGNLTSSKRQSFVLRTGALLAITLFVLLFPPAIRSIPKSSAALGQKTFITPKLSLRNLNPKLGSSLQIESPLKKAYLKKTSPSKPPAITAQSALIFDRDSKSILFSQNPHTQRFPASTTKIITASLILKNTNIEQTVIVPDNLYQRINGSWMGLKPGEKISRRALLWGMLLNSGNDAAYTLAVTYPGGYNNFLKAANQYVNSLGLKDTQVVNPHGMDNYNHYTTAFDLAIITDHALNIPLFRQIVGTKTKTVFSQNTPPHKYQLENTNKLLSDFAGVKGVKTGWTALAGEALVGLAEREGHEIIVVVLKSRNRENDSKKLINWTFANYNW